MVKNPVFMRGSGHRGRTFINVLSTLGILLDIVFMESPYDQVVTKPIRNDLLVTAPEDLVVTMPTMECILGDKLTAFAPHTTGVRLGAGKELEIVKQMFDVATLAERMQDQKQFRATYDRAVIEELDFRGLELEKEIVLRDTIRACISIISCGEYDKEDYVEYLKGIRSLGDTQGHRAVYGREAGKQHHSDEDGGTDHEQPPKKSGQRPEQERSDHWRQRLR